MQLRSKKLNEYTAVRRHLKNNRANKLVFARESNYKGIDETVLHGDGIVQYL